MSKLNHAAMDPMTIPTIVIINHTCTPVHILDFISFIVEISLRNDIALDRVSEVDGLLSDFKAFKYWLFSMIFSLGQSIVLYCLNARVR